MTEDLNKTLKNQIKGNSPDYLPFRLSELERCVKTLELKLVEIREQLTQIAGIEKDLDIFDKVLVLFEARISAQTSAIGSLITYLYEMLIRTGVVKRKC
jgi:hypothetical protein